MSYQVLARKWRPRTFAELVGQEHVARALINGLDNDRLHHAFLFTGTRGVGKTTIARIFAKALNCETGISSEPCGECAVCTDVDAGRFVDLIEVDAASRTKVEDTRELLENVQYAPARGRYKVYLIDEVHMLSTHSFNALLKTLEEPPPHVKFLLATTDPQKLPVTVLSRCLQFNLKRLQVEQISAYLTRVLEAEGVDFEAAAVDQLATAADGSMRDALSLMDQAIAHGGGGLVAEEVRSMLGTVARRHVEQLLEAIEARDADALWETVRALEEYVPDYGTVLRDLAAMLHEAAVGQTVRGTATGFVKELAERMSPEDVQLAYEIAVQGRAGLALAPDARTGFEMALLRMLAFVPGGADAPVAAPSGGAAPAVKPPDPGGRDAARRAAGLDAAVEQPPSRADAAPPQAAPEGQTVDALDAPADWHHLFSRLGLKGPAAVLAANSVLEVGDAGHYRLVVDPSQNHLRTPASEARIAEALERLFGRGARVDFVERTTAAESPAARQTREADERVEAARSAIEQDPLVAELVSEMGATVIPESIRPLNN